MRKQVGYDLYVETKDKNFTSVFLTLFMISTTIGNVVKYILR